MLEEELTYIGLTFLGTGNYCETKYQYNGVNVNTNLFPTTLEHFFPGLNKLLVIVTEDAKRKHLANCRCNIDIEVIDIPEGRNEDELWKIFNSIVHSVPDNSRLLIDVTHGYRSLPILILSVILYLKSVKNVSVDKIIYGAYEARDTDKNVSPVFELTQFVDLIDWSYATNDFIHHGNTSLLKGILSNIHRQSHILKKEFPAQSLKNFGDNLDKLSRALSLTRIKESVRIAKSLSHILKKLDQDIEHIQSSRPLRELLSLISERINQLHNEEAGLFSKDGFRIQLFMIEYYLKTEQYMQAVTLMREVIVSKFCVDMDHSPESRDDRDKVEKHILNNKDNIQNIGYNLNIPITKEYKKLWEQISNLRNDVNHAGMRPENILTETAINKIKDYFQQLNTLFRKYETTSN